MQIAVKSDLDRALGEAEEKNTHETEENTWGWILKNSAAVMVLFKKNQCLMDHLKHV